MFFIMKLLGAEIIPVSSGRGTLKDAMNEAMRDWVTNVRNTFIVLELLLAHPYPKMVRDFQSIIGKEAGSKYLKWRVGCQMRLLHVSEEGQTQWVYSMRF